MQSPFFFPPSSRKSQKRQTFDCQVEIKGKEIEKSERRNKKMKLSSRKKRKKREGRCE